MQKLLIKNLQNLAVKQKMDFEDYVKKSIECLENTLEKEISILKLKYAHNEQALKRIEEIVGK